MQNFTPLSALLGGSLIGLSAVFFLWLNGRITGISGIFHGLISPNKNDFLWRFSFLLGMMLGSQIYFFIPSIHFIPRSDYPAVLLILSGFLVGVGTKLSSGCTSGHGVCGIARLSLRSFVATGTFFVFGIIATYFIRHIIGLS